MWKYSSTTTNTTTTTNIGVKCRPFFLAVAGFDSHLLHFPTVKHDIHKTKSHDNRKLKGISHWKDGHGARRIRARIK